MKILVVNAGSSSLKYQLFDMSIKDIIAKGICERISGEKKGSDATITHTTIGKDKIKKDYPMPSHKEAMQAVIEMLLDKEIGCISSMDDISAVGHRIVHGGPYFKESVLVDANVIEDLNKCIDLAPLHTLPHLQGIAGCTSVMPKTPQVVVFDTAFHSTMPEEAFMYSIPYSMYENYKIRRYGFHGTSHRYVSKKAYDFLKLDPNNSKIITCHIGNGSSITAIKNGKVIDTSMGFTPLEGIMMGTRCGSMDPAIVPFIMKKEGYTPDEMNDFMNKKCGVLGVSEISSDLRDIEAAIISKNERAMLTARIMSYGIKKYIGAYTAAMNGLDAVIFTAGVGENTPVIRFLAMSDLDCFGIVIDSDINVITTHKPNEVIISKPESKVPVVVIPTNEELVIAEETQDVVGSKRKYIRKF
ncbi:MAG: acetate kinase [Oscillospiraceae bacterium]|nr:acetate kinase [Oscillospiraceae bacterium]